jgi:hypothetical protein
MSAATETTTLPSPAVNDMEALGHIRASWRDGRSLIVCGASPGGRNGGAYQRGGGRRVCAECERIVRSKGWA